MLDSNLGHFTSVFHVDQIPLVFKKIQKVFGSKSHEALILPIEKQGWIAIMRKRFTVLTRAGFDVI